MCEAEESPKDEEPDLPAWQRPEWELVRQIVASSRFIRLPTKFDVHEWAIMRDFADSVEPAGIREDLQFAIHGAGAFRHFKRTLERSTSNQPGTDSAPKPCGKSPLSGAKRIIFPGISQGSGTGPPTIPWLSKMNGVVEVLESSGGGRLPERSVRTINQGRWREGAVPTSYRLTLRD